MNDSITSQLPKGIVKTFDPELKRAFDFPDNAVIESRDISKLIMKPDFFKVSGDGVFYTLQGEGPTMGKPAAFLRLHICNLKCIWCDAWYTWNPNSKEFWTESKDWTIKETAQKVRAVWKCENKKAKKRLVITGGEPLIQQAKIEKLLEILKDWDIEIETNGTILPSEILLKRCQFNCSPKLKNSGNTVGARIKPNVIKALSNVNTVFKFVVMSTDDIREMEEEYIDKLDIPQEKILIMPQGVTSSEVQANAKNVAEYVKQKGYRLLLRLHVDLWGAKRRV